jgi:hypothetical protein
MEWLIVLAIIFQTTVTLMLGIAFLYLAFKIFNLEFGIGMDKKDIFTELEEKTMDLPKGNVPIEKFIPKKDTELKVKFSSKDQFTKV